MPGVPALQGRCATRLVVLACGASTRYSMVRKRYPDARASRESALPDGGATVHCGHIGNTPEPLREMPSALAGLLQNGRTPMRSAASERHTTAPRPSPLTEEPLLLDGGQTVERHLGQCTKQQHEWIARVTRVQPDAADNPTHQQVAGLQLPLLLLNQTVRDVEGRRDLGCMQLTVALQVEQDLLGGRAVDDRFQHHRPAW